MKFYADFFCFSPRKLVTLHENYAFLGNDTRKTYHIEL